MSMHIVDDEQRRDRSERGPLYFHHGLLVLLYRGGASEAPEGERKSFGLSAFVNQSFH